MSILANGNSTISIYLMSTLAGIVILLAVVGLTGLIIRKMSPGKSSPAVLGTVFLFKTISAGALLYSFLNAGLNAPFLALGITIGLGVITLKTLILNYMERTDNGNC